jgi:hypothetical protein
MDCLNDWGIGFSSWWKLHRIDMGSVENPAYYQMGTRSYILGVMCLECETDHWPVYSFKFKNVWSHASTPKYVFMVLCLIRHREDTFSLQFMLIYVS